MSVFDKLTNHLSFTDPIRDKLSQVWKSLGSTNILKEVWEGVGEGGEKEKEGGCSWGREEEKDLNFCL